MTSTPPESSVDMRDTVKILIEEFSKKLFQIMAQRQNMPSEGMGQSHSSENPNSGITIKLDGHNYRIWAQMVEMELKTRDKLVYVKGDQKILLPTDEAHKRWEIEDNMVKSWLIKFLDNSLVGSFINCSTARETGIENIERYNKIIQEERLFNFLNGLSDRLDQMRAHILQTSPLPTTEQAFAWVRREEVRHNLMVGRDEMSAAVMYTRTKPTLKSPSISTKSKTHLRPNFCLRRVHRA